MLCDGYTGTGVHTLKGLGGNECPVITKIFCLMMITDESGHSALLKKPMIKDPPAHVSNRLSPRSDAPIEKQTLVIGDSVLRNVRLATPATTVNCISGARTCDIESKLKLLAKTKHIYSEIVIHVGSNNSRLRMSEVNKVNVESLCAFAKTMLDTVVFSGPLANTTGDDMFTRMLTLAEEVELLLFLTPVYQFILNLN